MDENSGKLLWTFQNEQAPNRLFEGSPRIIVKDGIVFAISDTVSAHNATTGELLWQAIPGTKNFDVPWSYKQMHAYPLNGDPFDGNYVYAIAGDFSSLNFFKINTDNGSILWSSDVAWDGTVLTWGVDYEVWAPRVLAISQGQVLIETVFNGGSPVNMLFSLDSNSGKKLWSITLGAEIYGSTVYNNLLLFSKADGYFYALNLAHGTIAWKTKVDTQNLFSIPDNYASPIFDVDTQNHRLFWSFGGKQGESPGNYTGTLCSLDLANGNVTWIKQIETSGNGLVVNNDKIFLTGNNALWIFNASSGDLVQSQQFDHYILPPIVLGNETFVVADLQLTAYA